MHVLHTFANESSVPYLSWFVDRARGTDMRYTFLLMHRERPAMMDEMREAGHACEWIRYDDSKRKRGMVRALPWAVARIRAHRPDIVHCHMFDDTVVGLRAARLAGVRRRVMSRQDTGYHWQHAQRWIFLDRANCRLASHIIAISEESRRHMVEQEGVPEEKITLVHNGIPPERYTRQHPARIQALRERFGITDHFPVIGTVARFIPWKGYRHIVDAAERIVKDHPRARFLFCGHGEQEEEVRRWVHEAGLDAHVVFTGWVDRTDMASFQGLLDIHLHAATLEPFGLIYPEAMMNGTPVVSTATGAALDAITDGVNGILVNEASGAALADGVERLLNADVKAIGEAGRRTALEMFSFSNMYEGTMRVYDKAMRDLP